MKTPIKIIATVLAATIATSSLAAPASAFFYKPWYKHWYKPHKKVVPHEPKWGHTGKLVVGCIMGSAFGLITASIVKGGGLKLMTQKEFETTPRDKSKDLTNEEAWFIASTCGLGALAIRPAQAAPVVVKARY